MELEAEVAKLKEENEELRKKQVNFQGLFCLASFKLAFLWKELTLLHIYLSPLRNI